MTRPQWWRKPVLNTAEDHHEDRRVTWVELFFDLFFVVTIGQLAHFLSIRMNWEGVFEYAVLFIPVWWVWIGYTIYNERFETSGAESRIFAFLLMIPTAGLAVFVHGVFDGTYTGFALSYVIARAIITFLWFRAAYHSKPARKLGIVYGMGFSTSILFVLISVFLDSPYNYLFFGTALLIDLATPLATIELSSHLPKFSTTKLPERYGLFTIIVLGESIVGVLGTVADIHHINTQTILTSITGISITFCMWWMYFYNIGQRPFGEKTYLTFLWSYMHMPLVMAIAMSGACMSNVILLSNNDILDSSVRFFMSLSIFTVMIFISFIELTLRHKKDERRRVLRGTILKIITAIVILLIGIYGTSLTSIILLLSILILILINMVHGFFSYYRHDSDKI